MLVCSKCLRIIEAHEGHQPIIEIVRTPSENEVADFGVNSDPYKCEWCEDSFFNDELFEI